MSNSGAAGCGSAIISGARPFVKPRSAHPFAPLSLAPLARALTNGLRRMGSATQPPAATIAAPPYPTRWPPSYTAPLCEFRHAHSILEASEFRHSKGVTK